MNILSITTIAGKMRRLGKEMTWIVVGQIAAALGGIALVRVLTQMLTPESYGELALGMTLAMLMNLVVFAGPGSAAMRFFHAAIEKRELRFFLRALKRIMLARTYLMIVVGGVLITIVASTSLDRWSSLALSSLLFAFISCLPAVFEGMQTAARQRAIVACHQGVSPWLRILCGLGCIALWGRDSSTVMWGYAFSSLVIFISQYCFFRIRLGAFLAETPETVDTAAAARWIRQIGSYSWPFAVWGMFTWLQSISDRWALQMFATTAEVGRYAALFQVGYYPVSMGLSLLIQMVQPIIFNRAGSGDSLERQKHADRLNLLLLCVALVFTVLVASGAFFLHRQIFWLAVAPPFRMVSHLLPVIVLSAGIFACGQTASMFLASGKETAVLLYPKIGSAVFGIALNLAGAHWFGLTGIVWAGFAFSAVYAIWVSGTALRARLIQYAVLEETPI